MVLVEKMYIIFDFKGSIFGMKEKIKFEIKTETTVIEALRKFTNVHEQLESLIFKNDSIRSDILVLVDKTDVKTLNLLKMVLKEGQVITILPLAHGG